MAELRATKRNALLGLLADALSPVADYLSTSTNPVEDAGSDLSLTGLLGDTINPLAVTADRLSYGEPLTTGRGMTRQMRPETRDALLAVSPSGLGAKAAGRGAVATGKAISPQVENMLMNYARQVGGVKDAITPETYMPLKAMSREEFLGKPKIVGKSDAAQLQPHMINSTAEAPLVPFMDGKYQARYSPRGAAVFDGDKVIASYNFGDNLVVDPKYRNKGIAEELVYQQRTYFLEPAKAQTRNKVSQKIQEKVFDRIQSELPNYNPTAGLLDDLKPSQSTGLLSEPAIDTSYRIAHTAPMREGANTLDDLADIFPDDVYNPRVSWQYYGHGDRKLDEGTARIIAGFRGKPDAEVTIYRAVPKGVKDINPGDWVTVNKDYAKMHGSSWVDDGKYEIISKRVKAKEIATDGNSIHEFGYSPLDNK